VSGSGWITRKGSYSVLVAHDSVLGVLVTPYGIESSWMGNRDEEKVG